MGVFSNDLSSRGPCVAGLDLTGLKGHLPLDSLGPNGQFNFSPAIDFNGATSFTYTLGLVNGLGCDSTGNSATVTITVFELNDPPSILLESPCSSGITVAEDSGAYDSATHCVEMLDFGPLDENNQSFDAWLVSSTHPELFAAKPKVTQVDGAVRATDLHAGPECPRDVDGVDPRARWRRRLRRRRRHERPGQVQDHDHGRR